MNILKTFILVGGFSVFLSTQLYAQKEIYIQHIDFELTKISDIDYENEFFLTLKLTKGSKYKFAIVNNINERPGEAILELLDADNLVLTNIFGDKYYETANFVCNKTGFYDVLIRFKDNQTGHCQVDITMLQ